MLEPEWFVYLLRCGDNTLYCGIAKNVQQRFDAHLSGKGARYTRGRAPLKLIWQLEQPISHGEALKLERTIKSWPREKKIALSKKKM
jgi:putative endonuclease